MFKYKITNFSEIDEQAIYSYCKLNKIDASKNLGDISKVETKNVEDFDLLVGGSPCQDFSMAGHGKGAVYKCKDCGYEYNPLMIHYSTRDICPFCKSHNIETTRSSLIVHYLRFVREKKPKFAVYENVQNLYKNISFRKLFLMFIEEMKYYGYNCYYQVMNALDYGLPQDRKRIFVVAIRKDIDNGNFTFPKTIPINQNKVNLLTDIDEKYYLDDLNFSLLMNNLGKDNSGLINKDKYDEIKLINSYGKEIDYNPQKPLGNWISNRLNEFINEFHEENPPMPCIYNAWNQRVLYNYIPTLTTTGSAFARSGVAIIENNWICRCKKDNKYEYYPIYRIRKLTPLEFFRFMGFSSAQFNSVAYLPKDTPIDGVNKKLIEKDIYGNLRIKALSDTALYKQAGNSIAVNCLVEIFAQLHTINNEFKQGIRVCSLFSGIGAFESALKKTYFRFYER